MSGLTNVEVYEGPERREVSMIDPIQFGRLEAEVAALRRDAERHAKTMEHMATQIDALVSLADRSKGGLWVILGLASVIGGITTFIAERLWR